MYQCFTNPIMDGHHKTLNIITMSGKKQFDYLKGNRITDKEQSKITEVTANIWGLFFSPWALKSCNCLSKLIYQNDLSLFPSISTEQVKRGEVTLLGQNDNEPCWLQKKNKKNYILWVTWRLLQSMYLNIFMCRERSSYVWAAVCTPVMAVDYYIMLCMFYAIHFTGMIWLDICTD